MLGLGLVTEGSQLPFPRATSRFLQDALHQALFLPLHWLMPYVVDVKYLALQEQRPTPRPTWTLENIWRGTATWNTQGWAVKRGPGTAPPPAPQHRMGNTAGSLIYKSNQALLHPPQHLSLGGEFGQVKK